MITTVSKQTVVSTKPIEPGKFITPTALDRVMEHNHICVVYYYTFPGRWELGEITKLLREPACEIATTLPIATGRLVRDNDDHWIVKCNDAGIRMIEARAKGSLQDWLLNVDRNKELQLIHWEDMYHEPYFWSTFYIKVTVFEQGGVAIGVSGIHLLADPISITNFIKSWADTTLYRTVSNPPMIQNMLLQCHRRSGALNSYNSRLINCYKSYFKKSPSSDQILPQDLTAKNTTITLKFTDDMVRACIAMTKTSRISPFEALAAIFWVSISRVRGRKHLLNMSIFSDARNALRLQQASFGNCMVYNKVHNVDIADMEEGDQIAGARKAVEEAVDEINPENVMDLMEWLESSSHDVTSPPSNNACHDLICAKLDGRDPYSAMFQVGIAPVRVSYYLEPDVAGLAQVVVLPSPPDEGPLSRVVMITLRENEALMLCNERLIQRFSPTLVMGAGGVDTNHD